MEIESTLRPLLTFGVSIIASTLQAKLVKKTDKIANDRIPTITNTTCGAVGLAYGAAQDDPLTMVAGFAGATVQALGHALISKLFRKKTVTP